MILEAGDFFFCRTNSPNQQKRKELFRHMEDLFLFFCFFLSVFFIFLSFIWNEQINEEVPSSQSVKKEMPIRSDLRDPNSLPQSDASSSPVKPAVSSPSRFRNQGNAPKRARQIPRKCVDLVKICSAVIGKEIPRVVWKAIGGRKLKFLYRPKVQFIVNYSSSYSLELVNKWLHEEHSYNTDIPNKKACLNLFNHFPGSPNRQHLANNMKHKLNADKVLADGQTMKIGATFIPRGADSCKVILAVRGGRKHTAPAFQFLLLAESVLELLSPTTRCRYTCPDGCSVPVGLLN